MGMFWFIVGAIVVVAIVSAVWNNVQEGKRTRAWQEVAQQLGVTFQGTQNDVLHRYGRLQQFQLGSGQAVSNVLLADSGEIAIVLGDLRYTTGSGKSRQTHHRTVCVLESGTLQMPHCSLRPQRRLWDALGSLFGGQDIDFAEDPQFSRAYVLQGPDEAAIRAVFAPEVRAWFAERAGAGFHFEAQEHVLVFHLGQRLPPQQAPELMAQALQILQLLRSAGNVPRTEGTA
jgi:hypothetical protein